MKEDKDGDREEEQDAARSVRTPGDAAMRRKLAQSHKVAFGSEGRGAGCRSNQRGPLVGRGKQWAGLGHGVDMGAASRGAYSGFSGLEWLCFWTRHCQLQR